MKKKSLLSGIFLLSVLISVIMLTGCGGTGLDVAYEDLKEEFQSEDSSQNTKIEYDKKSDTLILSLDPDDVDADKLFDILNEDLEGADVGTISFARISNTPANSFSNSGNNQNNTQNDYATGNSQNNNQNDQSSGSMQEDANKYKESQGSDHQTDFATKVSKGIGSLSCSSIKCLDVSAVFSDLNGDDWTKILKKTEGLCIKHNDTGRFALGTDKVKKNIKNLKRLLLTNDYYSFNIDSIGHFSNIEELNFTAGITKEQRTENEKKGFVPVFSYGAQTKESVSINKLNQLKKLDRVLFFPEIEWSPNVNYYKAILGMQEFTPALKTNKPGKKWNGDDEGDLIAVSDIDVFKTAKKNSKELYGTMSVTLSDTLSTLLKSDAGECYDKGRKFKESSKKPRLNGKVFAYMAYPGTSSYDRKKYWNKEKFYTYDSKVLLKELKRKHIKVPSKPNDYDTFVYIFPRFSEYGRYDKGTIGHTRKTFVRVYDLKHKKKYKAVQIDTRQPNSSFRYYGSPPDVHYEDINVNNVVKYLKKL